MWFWTLASLGCAGVLDLVMGMFFVHLLSAYFSYPLHWWQYVIGAFLGASPDIDLFWGFFKKNQNEHHEFLTHRPIIGIPFAVALGWIFGGVFWAFAAGIGALWHYLHDTEGFLGLSDGGIAWFWPFSKKYWGMRNFRVVSRQPDCSEADKNALDWFYESYLVPTRRSVTEFALTGPLLGFVVGGLSDIHSGFGVTFLFWISVAGLWFVYCFRSVRS